MYRQNKYLFLAITLVLITALFIGCSAEGVKENTSQIGLQEEQNAAAIGEEIVTENKLNMEGEKTENPDALVVSEGVMIVHFIDVGQGDATLIQTPGGKVVLKDAGDRHMGSKVVSYLKSQGIDTIDLLIGSHPHVDHIGGMAEVIESFNVKKVSMPKVTHSTRTFEDLLITIKDNDLVIKEAKAGVSFDIDPLVELMLVAPNSPQYTALNDYSAVLRVVYKESSFLIAGDAELHSEMEIIKKNHDINIDVLRTGHHGSGTSSSSQFLNATSPKYAIISVGVGNRYNHPGRDVLTRLTNSGVEIYRTDVHGDIVFRTDGLNYDINIKQTYQYKPSEEEYLKDNTIQKINENSATVTTKDETGRININTASLEELQEIIHIGVERAEEIIRLRPFSSIDDLSKVSGIGAARIKAIREEGKAYIQ